MASHRCLPFPWKQWFHTTSHGDAPPPTPLPPILFFVLFCGFSRAYTGRTGRMRDKRKKIVWNGYALSWFIQQGEASRSEGKQRHSVLGALRCGPALIYGPPLWCTTLCRSIATLHVCLTPKCTCLFSSMPQHHMPQEAMGGSPHAATVTSPNELRHGKNFKFGVMDGCS